MKPAEQTFDLARLDATSQPLLGEAVATLRAHGPDATELASLASRLALAGVDVTLPTPAPPRASVRWKKWLAGGGAASGALIWLALSMKPPAPHAAAPNQASHALEVAARGQAPGGVVSAATRARSAAVLQPQQPTALQLAEPTIDPHETHEAEPAPPVAREVATASAARVASLAPPASAGAPAHSPSSGASHVASSAQLGTPELRGVPSEIELLRDARLALKQAPARALDLVDAHARAYPSGKLTQERELIGISALVALGRHTAALSRGARFQQAFPASPYRDQVEQLLR